MVESDIVRCIQRLCIHRRGIPSRKNLLTVLAAWYYGLTAPRTAPCIPRVPA